MTVTYTGDIANGGKFVCFWRVLSRWKGSLYKLIWQDVLCYCCLFVGINYVHANYLSTPMQLVVHKFKAYVSANVSMFPVPFVLSFFVDQVATKWWHQYQMVPSPDTLAIYTNATIPGKDEKSRMIRRSIVRYAILSLVLTLRDISTRVRKRFPTLKHVEEVGLILEEEMIHYDKLECQVTANNWMPLVWAANLATTARNLKKTSSDQCLRLLISELTAHRNKLGILVGYDLVNIPLVYTQTMVVVVVSYVFLSLFSQQPMEEGSAYIVTGFTISSLTNFIIYVGLMKVATVMLNPFGEDDDDFELNATIDRHIKAAYMIVDEMHEEEPDIVKDAYWDEIVPKELLYTVGSVEDRKLEPNCFEGEAAPEKSNRRRKSTLKEYSKKHKETSEITGQSSFKANSRSNRKTFNQTINEGFLNKGFSRYGEEIEVYDIPQVEPNPVASTSKQFYSQRRTLV